MQTNFSCYAQTDILDTTSHELHSSVGYTLNIYDRLPLNNFSSVLPVSLSYIPYFLHLFIFLSSFYLPLISSFLFESSVKLLQTATYIRFSYFVIRYIPTKKCGKLRVFVHWVLEGDGGKQRGGGGAQIRTSSDTSMASG
jgi:hypothetical protein